MQSSTAVSGLRTGESACGPPRRRASRAMNAYTGTHFARTGPRRVHDRIQPRPRLAGLINEYQQPA